MTPNDMNAPERIWVDQNAGINWHIGAENSGLRCYILTTASSLAASPEVQELIRRAEALVWDQAVKIGGEAAVAVLLRHEPDAGPIKVQMARQAFANAIRAAKATP